MKTESLQRSARRTRRPRGGKRPARPLFAKQAPGQRAHLGQGGLGPRRAEAPGPKRARPVEGQAFRSALHLQIRSIQLVAATFLEGAQLPIDRELGSRSDGTRLEFGKRRMGDGRGRGSVFRRQTDQQRGETINLKNFKRFD